MQQTKESLINKNTLIPISLVITLLIFTAYMERRLTTVENLFKTQTEKVKRLEDKSLPANEIIYRLNKIEETLEKIENKN